jgi:hypothetical protein
LPYLDHVDLDELHSVVLDLDLDEHVHFELDADEHDHLDVDPDLDEFCNHIEQQG